MKPNNASTDTTKTAARIYRKAAQLMERDTEMPWGGGPIRFACFAIGSVEYPREHHDLCERMRPIFEAQPGSLYLAWLGTGVSEREPEEINTRILALCFMAAMVEAGDA